MAGLALKGMVAHGLKLTIISDFLQAKLSSAIPPSAASIEKQRAVWDEQSVGPVSIPIVGPRAKTKNASSRRRADAFRYPQVRLTHFAASA
jgi:hypothetical protein